MAGPTRPATRGFLFADLRGYTDFVETRGDHAAAELLGAYRTLVREAVAGHEGAEVKTEGDSFYVVFPSASAAVLCGLSLVDAAQAWTSGHPDQPIRAGVGIHAGETVETGEGFVGSAVNTAARICAQAAAYQVLVSDTVRALTRTYLDVTFQPLGSRRLKGIAEPMPLYQVLPAGAVVTQPAVSRRARTAALAALGGVIGVVVLGILVLASLPRGTGASASTQPGAGPSGTAPLLGASLGATPSAVASTPSIASTLPASPSAAPATFPDASEADLLDRLPPPIVQSANCIRAPEDEAAVGAAASLRCDLRPGTGADVVWFDALDPSESIKQYTRAIDAHGVLEGSCESQPKAWQRWELKGFFDGYEVCYPDKDGAWILWTYGSAGLTARATRADGNPEALQDWWRDVHALLVR